MLRGQGAMTSNADTNLCYPNEGRYPTTENHSKSPGRHKPYNVEAGARAPGNLWALLEEARLTRGAFSGIVGAGKVKRWPLW